MLNFMYFHLIFWVVIFLKYLSGNMTHRFMRKSKMIAFVHVTCWTKSSVQICTISSMHYWDRWTNLYSPHGQGCTNLYMWGLYTLDWEKGVQRCTLPIFSQQIVTNCVKYHKFKVINVCMLHFNLISVEVCILLKY